MLFWPLMGAGCLLFALLTASLPGVDGTPPKPGEARTVFLLVFTLSTLFFGTLRLLVTRDYRPLRYGVLSVGVLATLTVAHSFRADLASMVNLVRGQMVPSLALSHTAGQIELRRGWDGHYRADGVVNGHPLRMMIDTGASMVLVPYEDAVAMGFKAE
ncbi:MAG: retroviral-like aspartic protease family protein, partial [Pseudomonadota bacterium]